MNSNEIIEALLDIDPSIHLKYSTYTRKWYIVSSIAVSNGSVIGGMAEHRESPESAVYGFWHRVIGIKDDEKLVVDALGDRKEYRWTGWRWRELHGQS